MDLLVFSISMFPPNSSTIQVCHSEAMQQLLAFAQALPPFASNVEIAMRSSKHPRLTQHWVVLAQLSSISLGLRSHLDSEISLGLNMLSVMSADSNNPLRLDPLDTASSGALLESLSQV